MNHFLFTPSSFWFTVFPSLLSSDDDLAVWTDCNIHCFLTIVLLYNHLKSTVLHHYLVFSSLLQGFISRGHTFVCTRINVLKRTRRAIFRFESTNQWKKKLITFALLYFLLLASKNCLVVHQLNKCVNMMYIIVLNELHSLQI